MSGGGKEGSWGHTSHPQGQWAMGVEEKQPGLRPTRERLACPKAGQTWPDVPSWGWCHQE